MWAQMLARGVPYGEAVGMKGRLKLLMRMFLRERPSRAREKLPFTGLMFAKLQRAVRQWVRGSRSAKEKFAARRLEVMVAAALEGLLRTCMRKYWAFEVSMVPSSSHSHTCSSAPTIYA
jgi:hypothetical protein